ncbi:hypothetical protein SAMN05216201_10946 [Pseudomonas linyingensis]|uniref:Helix-turn-helix domain-containing protein n=1 Tax=Pseudomonas linyingensis TaxID=915471 RepID=A0A1H6YZM2_9PSED|nr:hypothetical protein [Pseudomonas linyingensis]SEJ45816.1 hypothetical protein SAMN05216201_10946 [Pseudomonas linyingensis]
MSQELEDKVPEKKMAELLGITFRALQARRQRKEIPEGVWNRIGRSIIYSRRRYDEWLESQWTCPPVWKSETAESVSGSIGMESDAPSRSPIPRRKRASQLHPVYAIR